MSLFADLGLGKVRSKGMSDEKEVNQMVVGALLSFEVTDAGVGMVSRYFQGVK